ncbi:neuromedin U [Thiolapillus brandeum]|uniref:Neuromedin U n=1 Tax=Thiolapillus brandeum TaxID=1076588 RepID=A0A7U6GK85_9GAMM|nr:neuromedin U [Thiolapillus brandeum]BAO45089.1 conserved hypothetical protein [Thiolapillus brandeum]
MTMKKLLLCLGVTASSLSSASLLADEMSNEAIAKASQNPITMIYSLPIQNNTYFDLGDSGETKNVANFQPVVPMDLNEDWDIVWRMIMPITTTPGIPDSFNGDGEATHFSGGATGLGDTTLSAFLAPKQAGDLIWGVGGALYMPTATEDVLKTKQWGMGPSVVGLRMDGNWTYGALIMNVWSFGADKPGDKKIDFLQLQPFINYNLGDGWFLTSVPIITAFWDQDSDNRWTVPLGGGFGRGFKIGNVPVSATAQAYYNVVSPDATGEKWTLRLQMQVFFPRK